MANAVSIHNELVRTEPELAAELYGTFPYDLRGEHRPGARPWYLMFVNNYHVLHARDAYQDDREAGRIRHLKSELSASCPRPVGRAGV